MRVPNELALCTAAALGVIAAVLVARSGNPPTKDFELLSAGLYKLELTWRLAFWTSAHDEVLDMYLVAQQPAHGSGLDWLLTDAGGHDTWLQAHASAVAAAVARRVGPSSTLKYILLTHGHVDHVGALPKLLAAYPGARVVLHEAEAPVATGSRLYMEEATWLWRLLQALSLVPWTEYKVPADKVLLLHGTEGNMTHLGITDLRFIFLAGHTAGHTAYLHVPSQILLAGDFADVLLNQEGSPYLKMYGGDGWHYLPDQGHRSICRVAFELEYNRAMPYHDATKQGFSAAQLQPLAEAYSNCSALGFDQPA